MDVRKTEQDAKGDLHLIPKGEEHTNDPTCICDPEIIETLETGQFVYRHHFRN